MTRSSEPLDSQLTLVAALDLAIFIERDARDRYVTLARVMDAWGQPEAGAFFLRMAKLEEEHRDLLQKRRDDLWPEGQQAPSAEQLGLTVPQIVEGPATEDEAMRLTLRTSLELAVRAENCAKSFFLSALQVVTDPAVKTLFHDLAAEEVEHEDLLRRELAQLAALE